MTEQILPCPFCGWDKASAGAIRDGYQVHCRVCFAAGPPTYHGPDITRSTEQRAIKAWNIRSAIAKAEGRDEIAVRKESEDDL